MPVEQIELQEPEFLKGIIVDFPPQKNYAIVTFFDGHFLTYFENKLVHAIQTRAWLISQISTPPPTFYSKELANIWENDHKHMVNIIKRNGKLISKKEWEDRVTNE